MFKDMWYLNVDTHELVDSFFPSGVIPVSLIWRKGKSDFIIIIMAYSD